DLVRARDVGLALALLVRERPHTRVRVGDALHGDARIRQHPSHLAEEVAHLVPRGVHPLEVTIEVGVGRADERELTPRDHEDHPAVARRVVDRVVREPGEQAVYALRAEDNASAALMYTRERPKLDNTRHGRDPGPAQASRRA